jgi:hypothetical protein
MPYVKQPRHGDTAMATAELIGREENHGGYSRGYLGRTPH